MFACYDWMIRRGKWLEGIGTWMLALEGGLVFGKVRESFSYEIFLRCLYDLRSMDEVSELGLRA